MEPKQRGDHFLGGEPLAHGLKADDTVRSGIMAAVTAAKPWSVPDFHGHQTAVSVLDGLSGAMVWLYTKSRPICIQHAYAASAVRRISLGVCDAAGGGRSDQCGVFRRQARTFRSVPRSKFPLSRRSD